MDRLSKLYIVDEDRYSRSTKNSFERKCMKFLKHCEKADLPSFDRHHTASIILAGHARPYCFDVLKT